MSESRERAAQIEILRVFPTMLEARVIDLTPEQLTTPYNAPEWTIAQNVHHLADSHMNSFIRFKLIMTEESPILRPYNQEDWARTADANQADIWDSMAIIRGLHARWITLITSVYDFDKGGYHPEYGPVTLGGLVASYANHCQAHLKQIEEVLDKMPR